MSITRRMAVDIIGAATATPFVSAQAQTGNPKAMTVPTTTSSGTSEPLAIKSLAFSPIGVSAATAARSISPVESCTMP